MTVAHRIQGGEGAGARRSRAPLALPTCPAGSASSRQRNHISMPGIAWVRVVCLQGDNKRDPIECGW